MPIHREGEFLVWPDATAGQPMLGLESAQLDACVEQYKRGAYRAVLASPSHGFRERNLDVLRRLEGLENIWFWDVDLDDLEGLYAHPDLAYLGLHGKCPAIDFSRFRSLSTVSTDWRGRDQGLSQCDVAESYLLWHHKPRTKSMRDLETPKSCRCVEFNWTNARSLEGLTGLRGAESLEIHRSRNLVSLAGIEVLRGSLRRVIVDTCGKLQDPSALDDLPHLGVAIINGERYPS